MAYNLESLIRILQQILNPDSRRWILDHKKIQLESLLQKASSLKQILENSPSSSTESLRIQIREAAHKAEDILESHMVAQMHSRPGDEIFSFSPPDLQEVIQELDSAMENPMKIVDRDYQTVNSYSAHAVSSSKNIVVGLEEDMIKLKDFLTWQQSKLEIIPIVGMGGIGKTTLARNLYNDPLILSHFPTRAWTTISQDYNVRAILLDLLGCIIGKLGDELLQEENDKLAIILYKSLFGRRYLIVLDDMWSTEAWDYIKLFFPNENNGSRIMLTTRQSNVAEYVDSRNLQHQMHLLNKCESWNLLLQEVFGEENCPIELESIGRYIASCCGGLPLAIHVIGGLLSKDKRRKYLWERVANDARARATIAEEDEHFSNILSLSYNHLPDYLKPCFLYMGAFPEDYRIRATQLIRLWVAEGFLKSSNGDKTLEEEAEDCLKALVDRNLVYVAELKSNGKARSYVMHDLMRDLCVRKAGEEKFLYVKNGKSHNALDSSICSLRRVRVFIHLIALEIFMFQQSVCHWPEPSYALVLHHVRSYLLCFLL